MNGTVEKPVSSNRRNRKTEQYLSNNIMELILICRRHTDVSMFQYFKFFISCFSKLDSIQLYEMKLIFLGKFHMRLTFKHSFQVTDLEYSTADLYYEIFQDNP